MFAGYAADFPLEVGRSIPGEIHLRPHFTIPFGLFLVKDLQVIKGLQEL
jgi:hypothetical protein